jgi:membrane-associated phospholipid phosphatase
VIDSEAVARFDDAADAWYGRLRGHPVADRFARVASHFGEFSGGWQLASLLVAVAHGRPKDALRRTALIGLESLVVNQGIKRLANRTRPLSEDAERLGVRRPISSSFPSGHASAAFFAASLLSAEERRLAPLWFGLAMAVAASRPYVRLHHASDVVAGAATGLALAAVAKRVWPAPE